MSSDTRPSSLASHRAAADGALEQDMDCQACGYNLRGLPVNARCPECGLPVGTVPTRIDAPLSLMPIGMIRGFRFACILASISVVGVIILAIAGASWVFNAKSEAAIFTILAVLWLLGTWRLTAALGVRPGIARGFGRRSVRRRAARWLQFGWLAAAGLHVVQAIAPAMVLGAGALPQVLDITILACVMAGLVGMAFLATLLQGLADWVYDREAGGAFNIAMWTIPLTSALLVLIRIPSPIVVILLGVFWILSIATFPFALISLSRSVAWSVAHAREQQDRLRRQRDRDERDADRLRRVVEAMDKPSNRS